MPRKKSEFKRAWSVDDVLKTHHEKLELSPDWHQAFANPKSTGVWFIWGHSGNGKTSFEFQLAKEMCRFDRVIINSLEEGNSDTWQNLYKKLGAEQLRKKLLLVEETMDELDIRLSQPKSPKVVIVDSFQYTFMTFQQYLAFKRKHADKLIIFLSQADGKMPEGRTAKRVMHDAALKIWVEGFKAFSKGRYFGPNGGTYTIWHEKAVEYHGAA
jgi:hypothetical protein